jgi:hypothetical protein
MQATTKMVLTLLASLLGAGQSAFGLAGMSCLQKWSLGAQLFNILYSSKM